MTGIYNETFCKNSYLVHFLSQAQKIQKSPLNTEALKKILILKYFLKRRPFLYFQKRTPQFFLFQETELSKLEKWKKQLFCFLCFRKWNFLAPSLKNLYFSRGFEKKENQIKNMLKVVSYGVFSIFTTVKPMEISCEPCVIKINF